MTTSLVLQLGVCVIFIRLTSSQPTYDVTGRDTDIDSCGRMEQVLSQLMDTNSQLNGAVSQLASVVSQQQRDIDDLKTGNRQQNVNASSSCLPVLVLQNIGGSLSFNRSWAEYKAGFDDGQGNYWLGNDMLHQLTVYSNFRLRVDLQSRSGSKWYWAEYSSFIVLSESANYKIHVGGYAGNANFDAMAYHNGMMFSAYDRDNDKNSGNCAAPLSRGGFWYDSCWNFAPTAWQDSEFYWHNLPGDRKLLTTRMWLLCP